MKNWVATTYAHAAQAAGFKRCCLDTGHYDGSERNHFFQAIAFTNLL